MGNHQTGCDYSKNMEKTKAQDVGQLSSATLETLITD